MHVEHGGDVVDVVVLQARQTFEDSFRCEDRHGGGNPAAEPPSPEEGMQVDHVVGMTVGHHHRVDAVGDRRPYPAGESGEGAVAQVEHDPEALVLDNEATARAPRLWPGSAAPQHDETARHAGSLAACTVTVKEPGGTLRRRDSVSTWVSPCHVAWDRRASPIEWR
jgi:hypothetical protein